MRRTRWIQSRQGVLYLIQAGKNGPIKVGWALVARNRIAALQAGNAQKLHVLATCTGNRLDEGEMHGWLADWWIRGDWFKRAALPTALLMFQEMNDSEEEV